MLYIIGSGEALTRFNPVTGSFTASGCLPDAGPRRYRHGQICDGHLYTYYAPGRTLRKIRLADHALVDE
ncbi:MAG: hypothetical protein RDU89_10880 [bacterium]|nr:hypothetical protein [bacterium]